MDIEQFGLNRYISSSGFCSRREADKLIEQARVTINDELALPGAKINPGDVVAVDGEPIKTKKKPIYIAFNKPVGVTSTTDVKDKSNIIYFINYPKRIFPVGRLDKDSDGLIFLTNDGDIVNKILRASNNHEKEYLVTVDKLITPDFIKQMGNGVPVLDTVTNPCYVRQDGGRRFRITLTQGLNRQIRRMCEYLGYEVKELTRIRIMNVQLDNLAVGKWRYFTIPEIEKMNQLVSESVKIDTPAIKTKKTKTIPEKPPVTSSREEKPGAKKATEKKKAAPPEKTPKKKSTYAEFRSKRWR